MRTLIFLLSLLPLCLAAQNGILPKTNATSIKTGLSAHGYTTSIQDVEAFYSGNDVYTAIGQVAGGIRAVSHEKPPAWFAQGDTTLIKTWTQPELYQWVTQEVQFESLTCSTYLALNRRCVLVAGGHAFEGIQLLGVLTTAQADLQAFALAVVNMFNYEDFDELKQ